MYPTRRFTTILPAVAAMVGCLVASSAMSAETDDPMASMQSQIQSLKQEVAQLRGAEQQQWLDARRAEEVKGLIREVLADADTRASLMQEQVQAGYDNGFFLKSVDGNFLLKVFGQIQFRYVFDERDDSGADDHRAGFETSRVRYGFKGHVIDPSWQYFILTGDGASGDNMTLDVWIKKDLGHGLSITGGQFKVPFWREWLVSETKLQVVERSLLNSAFSGSYTQGLMLGYKNDRVRANLSLNDGVGTRNTPWYTEEAEYAVSGRAELLLAGKWNDVDDLEAWPGDDLAVMLGAAAVYQHGEEGTATVEGDLTRWTVDVTAKWNSLSLLAAVVGSHPDNGESLNQLGALIQAGWFVTPKIELFGRYEWGDLDNEADENLSILTAGANYFFRKHQVKLSGDVGYSFNPVTAGWAGSGSTGWQTDGVGQDGQIVVRGQLQLLF